MPHAKRVPPEGNRFHPAGSGRSGFTLVEMLVSVAILLILMGIIFQIIQMTSQAWKQSSQGTGTMQQARVAFERMTRTLSQATLNTYYSYDNPNAPTHYLRQSELQFISGNSPVGGTSFISTGLGNATQITQAVFFQAPLGLVSSANSASYGNLNNLLNACGYFVIYGPDTFRPTFLNGLVNKPQNENRFRLMEYLQPSDYLNIYTTGSIPSSGGTVPSWVITSNGSYALPTDLTTAQTSPSPVTVRPLASNIVALIVMPEQFTTGTATSSVQQNTAYLSSQANSYNYDSAYKATAWSGTTQTTTGNQLPPLVKVIMVAIDEPSAFRLASINPAASSTVPPALVPATLFQDPTKLFTGGGVQGDLDKLQDILNATAGNLAGNKLKLNYFIFQTDVIIRGSKWTSQ